MPAPIPRLPRPDPPATLPFVSSLPASPPPSPKPTAIPSSLSPIDKIIHRLYDSHLEPNTGSTQADGVAPDIDQLWQACELAMKQYLTRARGSTTASDRAQRFNTLLLQGEVRRAVRYITERENFAIHNPTDTFTTDGETPISVLDVLHSQHPIPSQLRPSDLPKFESVPHLPRLHFTDDHVCKVATKLGGACGLSGIDGHTLKTWLLYYGAASSALRTAFQQFVTWQANNIIPWAALRALKSKRGLALNKFPGVRPIGIGNIEDRFLAKLLLAEAGPSATDAAGIFNVSAGLPAGIEAAVHAAHEAWTATATDDNFGFLLIDARNAFNELDRNMMLYVLRHIWPQGARFIFNSYHHWSTILFHNHITGTATPIVSACGVTQGDPLAMIAYCLTLTPLSRQLHEEFPSLLQLWAADDNSAGGPFGQLKLYFTRLTALGKPYGYFVQPTKCKLITREHNIP